MPSPLLDVHVPRWKPTHSPDDDDDDTPSLRVDVGSELRRALTVEQNVRVSADGASSPALLPNKGEGVYLIWKDLGVIVQDKKAGGRAVLQGLTGYAQPGEVLVIMGPSGCGKSILLHSLAGRLDSGTIQTGEILINGRPQALVFGTISAFVTQEDTLMTTLTVWESVYYSAQLQLPDSMSTDQKKERAEATIREMGLQDAMSTRIGGESVRGLSQGQKQIVRICIGVLNRPKLLFLDKPTSGLDSAASYHVMNNIVRLTQDGRAAVVLSIHQPSTQVFQLFNNLCLLSSSGKTVYFGSISSANEFFKSNGFPCPHLRNPSDHYLRIINRDFDAVDSDNIMHETHENGPDIEDGTAARNIAEIDDLVASYKSSDACQQVQHRLLQICSQQNGGLVAKKESQAAAAGFITQCVVLTKRSFVTMHRDLKRHWHRFAVYIAQCLCIVAISYYVGHHDNASIQVKHSMLMFVVASLIFMGIGGFPSFVEDMKIFTHETLNGHCGVGAFVVGKTLSSIPYLAFISIVPGGVAYYLVLHLQSKIVHFAYFVLMLFAILMLNESLMMIVAIEGPEYLLGIIAGIFYPMYYIALNKYASQGFYKNQFFGLQASDPTPTGDKILKKIWIVKMGNSKWVDITIVFVIVVLYRFIFFFYYKIRKKIKLR